MASEHETILCYGLVCIDALIQLRDYPAPNGSALLVGERECIGGDATNTAVILAGLGNRVRLAGNRLGRDRRGRWLRRRLARVANLDTSLLHLDPQAVTPRNIILTARDGSRTILVDPVPLIGVPLSDEDFASVAMVVLDAVLDETALAVAKQAHARGIPVCANDARADSPLAPLCTVVIDSTDLTEWIGDRTQTAPERLLGAGVRTMIETAGAQGCHIFTADGSRFHQPAFPIEAIDTTGAGDAFRAGITHGMLRGWTLPGTVRFASAVAALNCQTLGACEQPPTVAAVNSLLDGQADDPSRDQ
jgi:sugar/nucleoside kinase (ribokinase family)